MLGQEHTGELGKATPPIELIPNNIGDVADQLKKLREVVAAYTGGLVPPSSYPDGLGGVDVSPTIRANLIQILKKAEDSMRDMMPEEDPTERSDQ